ncbi:YiaA/YiaB family inner membrane protein [Mycolicibacterium sp. Y3]
MSVPPISTKTTAAFLVQCIVAFGISFVATVVGILFLPLDPWQRLFLGISVLFLVSSTFGLAKVVRDQQEASTVRVRIDEARVEQLLAEHNPLATC